MASPLLSQELGNSRAIYRRKAMRLAAIIGVVGALWTVATCFFVVDVTEFGVVSRFGDIVRVEDEPGLHIKVPFDDVIPVTKRLLLMTPENVEFLTADKKNVVIRSLVQWRIDDPRRFLESLANIAYAEQRLSDVILGEIGAVLGEYQFGDLISAQNGQNKFLQMLAEIRDGARAAVVQDYGLDIVDVDIRRFSLPEQNKANVFERMKAERGRIAKKYRSEGELEKTKIIAAADRQAAEIMADAYAESQRIRAEGEAEAMRTYAAAFDQDPKFYRFLRTLQAYEVFLDENTTIFLPADAEVFRLLRQEVPSFENQIVPPEPEQDDNIARRRGSDLFDAGQPNDRRDNPPASTTRTVKN